MFLWKVSRILLLLLHLPCCLAITIASDQMCLARKYSEYSKRNYIYGLKLAEELSSETKGGKYRNTSCLPSEPLPPPPSRVVSPLVKWPLDQHQCFAGRRTGGKRSYIVLAYKLNWKTSCCFSKKYKWFPLK